MNGFPISLEAPGMFAGACALALLTAALVAVRRPAIHATTAAACGVALMLLALAVGGLTWRRPATGSDVVVMVDLSASTRGAGYRDRAELDRRVRELLGSTPYHLVYFSDHNTADAPVAGGALSDLAGERTVFAPPAAVAVVLFSDGRFELPAAGPPTFAVADPALDQVDDAAVNRLETRGKLLAVTVQNGGGPRRLTLDGAATKPVVSIDAGAIMITRGIRADAGAAAAKLDKGDRWPENDSLSLPLAAPMRTQRWFVSTGPAPAGEWMAIRPEALPTKPSAYLAPGVIVLDNLAASDLSGAQQAAIEQYVRDLGGALIIAGGDRAFSRGMYSGTALDALSPLATSPPAPSVHWMLLADSSGSMSQAVGEATRWQLAASAIGRLLPNLPPEDPVSAGSFAGELRWWSDGKSARETAAMALPPPGVSPGGPTNLAAALERIAREADGAMAGELLIVSDVDVVIEHADELARRLAAKKIRLHVLAIGDGRGLEALASMTAATGGTLRRQLDPRQWATEVRQLLTAAWPERLVASAVNAMFSGDLSPLPGRAVAPWNRTWLKKSASELANGKVNGETVPLCARWTVGSGEVIACGFAPTAAEVAAMARLIARPPRDPRFTVAWDAGPRLIVRVGAAQSGQYLNGLALRLELADEQDPAARLQSYEVPQTAPGHYELSLPAPRRRSFATLRHDDDGARVIDRIAVAARYAPEFDAVGNDYAALRALTERTGGRLIDRAWRKAIDLPFPRRELSLAPWLALAGAGALGVGLARWRVWD
jgi:hypothetical protein